MSNVSCDKAAIVEQLKLIEEQVRKIEKMVGEGQYCVEILDQLADVNSATHEVGLAILESQVKSCLREALTSDGPEGAVKDLIKVVERFV